MVVWLPIKNRTIFTGDNLHIMRGMEGESVDLIYLDPPFNSNHNYAAPIGSKAAGAAFRDTWTLNDIDEAWWGEIADSNPGLYKVLEAAGLVGGDSVKSYLIYMAIRILEMHRLLKETGSLYLHCDPTMSHYLKIVLDAVFGRKSFKNEIIWKRHDAHNDTKRAVSYGAIHDTIFFFAKSPNYQWTIQFTPYAESYINKAYKKTDHKTKKRFKTSDLTANNPGSYYEWKGIRPSAGRYWAYPERRMSELDKEGSIYYSKSGMPYLKNFADEMKGIMLQDVWNDVTRVSGKESLHYPTQKPIALLERITKASSNEGDFVLDPFCGCATACSAAEKLGRKWIGIDISSKAYELVLERLRREAGIERWTKGAGEVIHRTDIPVRKGMRSTDIKHSLFGIQEGRCNLCRHEIEFRHMEVDHVIPRAKGGPDDDSNLQLLCGHCNRVKRDGTMSEARVRLAELGVNLIQT